ncbi:CocE/NonD family hydrolase C-terminal non-catalytic domain-containing protein [Alkalimarinus coralli]|nr:CocE/NonD family hydrolase C-terminal non-catalytic domain-containing protein [Alkalimarinus coralli]
MEVKSNGHVETFDDYPVPGTQMVQYHLHPRGFGLAGELEDAPFQSRWSRSDYINSYLDTLADSGIPVISQLVEQFDIPTTAYIPAISRLNGVWYETNRLDRTMKIRGNANLTLQFEPLNSQVQVVAYLYDMKPSGMGTLITHAPFTLPVTQSGKAITLDFDLLATAYDVPQGHKLVLAIDTQDSSYGKLPDSKFKLKIKYHSGQQSVLKLPVL